VQSAQAVKAATLRELEDSIKRLVNKMENIPQLTVSNPKAEEIIKTMEETYELEQFFSKLSCFKGDSNIERLKKTNQRNEENLKASLNSVSTDLSQLTSK
jgi:flagellar biosynthesis/type III secretory pathway chaperone